LKRRDELESFAHFSAHVHVGRLFLSLCECWCRQEKEQDLLIHFHDLPDGWMLVLLIDAMCKVRCLMQRVGWVGGCEAVENRKGQAIKKREPSRSFNQRQTCVSRREVAKIDQNYRLIAPNENVPMLSTVVDTCVSSILRYQSKYHKRYTAKLAKRGNRPEDGTTIAAGYSHATTVAHILWKP